MKDNLLECNFENTIKKRDQNISFNVYFFLNLKKKKP
jgi:hypothetical protein